MNRFLPRSAITMVRACLARAGLVMLVHSPAMGEAFAKLTESVIGVSPAWAAD